MDKVTNLYIQNAANVVLYIENRKDMVFNDEKNEFDFSMNNGDLTIMKKPDNQVNHINIQHGNIVANGSINIGNVYGNNNFNTGTIITNSGDKECVLELPISKIDDAFKIKVENASSLTIISNDLSFTKLQIESTSASQVFWGNNKHQINVDELSLDCNSASNIILKQEFNVGDLYLEANSLAVIELTNTNYQNIHQSSDMIGQIYLATNKQQFKMK